MDTSERKSLLYKSGVEYADYALTHVEGCAHECKFPCYAMKLDKRRGRIKTDEEWKHPRLVANTLELLASEIPKHKDRINSVFLSFMTDPFMYQQPEVADLSLKVIRMLNDNGIRCVTVTKGNHALMQGYDYYENNEYGITLVSLYETFRQRFEPGAAPFNERIGALKALHEAGLRTWVSMEPYPTPNISDQEITRILESVCFVDKIIFGRWNDNALITKHLKQNPDFYKACSEKVAEFCGKHNIHVAFKGKTAGEKDPRIETIFSFD